MRMTSMRVLVLAAVLPAGAAWAQSTGAGGFSLPGSSGSSGSTGSSTQATGTETTGAGAFDPAIQAVARLLRPVPCPRRSGTRRRRDLPGADA